MSLTHAELESIIPALDELLGGSRVREIRESKDVEDEWIFSLRQPGENLFLVVSIEPEHSRLSLSDERQSAPTTPTTFTMLLRARVGGGLLRTLRQLSGDRVVLATIETLDETGDVQTHVLALELMGRHGNLYLLDKDSVIIGVADPRKASIRGLTAGGTYEPPEPAPEQKTTFRPGWNDHDNVRDRLSWLEHSIDETRRERRRAAARTSIRSRLRSEAKRLRRKARNIEGDLERATSSTALKRRADLLQSAYGRFSRGTTSVHVVDYFDPEQPTVEIETDPNVPLPDQIEQLYSEAKRLNAAIPGIEQRLAESWEKLEQIESLRDEFDDLEVDEISARVSTLEENGVLRTTRRAGPQRGRSTGNQRRTSYRTFISSDGWHIFVGRSARDNDELTLKVANGRDLWLHARDWPGSHVIVRREQKKADIPPQTLREAALLAAHYSGGSEDTSVEVGYTERKHVSKPRGAAPGMVSVAGMKTLLVTPDPTVTQRLTRADK